MDKNPNGYRILCGKTYLIYRQEFGGRVFHKTEIGRDKMGNRVYKNVSFFNDNKDTDIPDGTYVKPLSLYETFYFRKGDNFNPIFTVAFTDWEIVESQAQAEEKAEQEYKQYI